MVKQITLKKHLEDCLKAKCGNIAELDTKLKHLGGAILSKEARNRLVEDFTFSVKNSKAEVESAIKEFYRALDYKFLGETEHRGYIFAKEDSLRIVTLTYFNQMGCVTVLKE